MVKQLLYLAIPAMLLTGCTCNTYERVVIAPTTSRKAQPSSKYHDHTIDERIQEPIIIPKFGEPVIIQEPERIVYREKPVYIDRPVIVEKQPKKIIINNYYINEDFRGMRFYPHYRNRQFPRSEIFMNNSGFYFRNRY